MNGPLPFCPPQYLLPAARRISDPWFRCYAALGDFARGVAVKSSSAHRLATRFRRSKAGRRAARELNIGIHFAALCEHAAAFGEPYFIEAGTIVPRPPGGSPPAANPPDPPTTETENDFFRPTA